MKKNIINQVVNVDYLELSFTDSKLLIPVLLDNPNTYSINNECFIEYINDVNNKFFYNICNIYINSRLIGEIKFNPKTNFLKENTVHFKISNHLLYHSDYLDYIQYLIDLGFVYSHIVRLDICMDVITYFLLKFLKRFNNSNSIYCRGRAKKENCSIYGKEFQTYYIGSLSSDKYVKVYNKSKELLNSDKEYIKYFWKINGLDYINNEVERIELTLKQKQTRKIDVFKLLDSNYLASILKTHFKNYFDFFRITKSEGKTYERDITPINFKTYKTVLIEKYKYIPQYTNKPVKIEIKRLYINLLNEFELQKKYTKYQIEFKDSEKAANYFNQAIQRLIELYDLETYYFKNEQNWILEFKKNNNVYINNCNYSGIKIPKIFK